MHIHAPWTRLAGIRHRVPFGANCWSRDSQRLVRRDLRRQHVAAPLVGAFASGLAPSLVAAALPVLKAGCTDTSVSRFGAAASLAASAALFALLRAGVWTPTRATGVLLAVLLALFLAFFTFGPGVCVWTFAAEILPVSSVWGFAPLFALLALAAFAYFMIALVMRQTVV